MSASITAAVFVVALVGLSGRDRGAATTPPKSTTPLSATARRALAVLDEIPQSDTMLGDPHAPITITLFADLECPVCRSFALSSAFRKLVSRQVKPGRARIVFRSLCTTTCSFRHNSMFSAQQIAAYAAGRQNRLWEYALLFFAEQHAGAGYATPAYLEGLAIQVPGLDLGRWQQARARPALRAQLRGDASIAHLDHLSSTPTLVLTTATVKVTLIGAVSYQQLARAMATLHRLRAPHANAIVKTCLSTGRLTRGYSKAQLRAALRSMPASVKEYSNCQDVIRHALQNAR